MRNCTDITLILDRSGSMEEGKDDMEGALKHFINEQKKVTMDECVFTEIHFDAPSAFYASNHVATQLDWYIKKTPNPIPISQVGEIKIDPRGGTALLDAVGRTIIETGQRLSKMQECDRPNKVLIIILTDGQENSSREFSRERVMTMVKEQEQQYNWTFVFLGANIDAYAGAESIGSCSSNALNFSKSRGSTKKMSDTLSKSVSTYRAAGGQSVGTQCNFFGGEDCRDEVDSLKVANEKLSATSN